MIRRAAIGSRLARRPLVVKLVVRRGVRAGGAQRALRGDARRVPARRGRRADAVPARDADASSSWRAARVLPERLSARRGACAGGSTRRGSRCSRTPHRRSRSCRRVTSCAPSSGSSGKALVFAGRLGPQKALGVALEALVDVPGVTLAVAGDGPERSALERRAGDARARRARLVSRQRAACAGAPAVSCGRRVRAPVGLGELPAHGRRGPRGRLPRHRDGGRWRARGRARRRERAPRATRRSGSAGRGDRALLLGRRPPCAARRGAPPSVEGYSEETVFTTIEAELQRAVA